MLHGFLLKSKEKVMNSKTSSKLKNVSMHFLKDKQKGLLTNAVCKKN